MYAYIKGKIEHISDDSFIIENNGIGYLIMSSANVIGKLSVHEQTTVYTYLHVREDGVALFGFLTQDEITVFKMLISVSGIGPKGALAIMSVLTVDELRIAVLSEDHKAIAKANGVVAKTAQRVVIELKDKFKLDDVLSGIADENELPDTGSNDIITETAMALTSLGYSNVEALRAIKKVKDADKMSVEDLLKSALKHIM